MKEIFINLSGSKSITNRLLILNALYDGIIQLKNMSQSQDSDFMQKALSGSTPLINIHHAGTAMRFLTAFYSIKPNNSVVLTGSARMKERPIKILVDALNLLGAKISYLENVGFPPLKIIGKKIKKNYLELPAHVSSQYITALCLIGSQLENGLKLELKGKITSVPYITLTIQILNKLGISAEFNENFINIPFTASINAQQFIIESDWSSASYHYSICALGKDFKITLKYLFKNSLQADRKVVDIYEEYFGVKSFFYEDRVVLEKVKNFIYPTYIELDMNKCPDIAQTVAVTAFGLQIPIKITGLETLKIKETDRLQALKNELEKCGAEVIITSDSIEINKTQNFIEKKQIKTYNDHRMAMSFIPLQLLFRLEIEDPEVVNKSYTEFWEDMKFYKISYK